MAPSCFATSAPQNCPRLPCPAARALKAEALPGLVLGELPHGEFSLLQANFALIPCSVFPLFQAIGRLWPCTWDAACVGLSRPSCFCWAQTSGSLGGRSRGCRSPSWPRVVTLP